MDIGANNDLIIIFGERELVRAHGNFQDLLKQLKGFGLMHFITTIQALHYMQK